MMTEKKFRKKNWEMWENDILFGKKKYLFERVRLKTAKGQKRRNRKEKKNWRGFTEMKKRKRRLNETRRSCKKKERIFFKSAKQEKRVKMRRVDRESEHQEGTHKERKHEKCQHKEKKGEWGRLQNERNLNRENFCWQGISKIRSIKNKEKKGICYQKKVEKTKRMRQAKRDTSWKEIETEGKWQKMKQTDFTGKKGLQKGKTRRYTKGKKRKKNEKERKEVKEEWAKMKKMKTNGGKKQKNKGGQNRRLESTKGSHKKWSRSEKMIEAIFERCTKKINF